MTDKNRESEQRNEREDRVPILRAGIGTRIKAASERVGSRRSAAFAAGVSEDMLYRYMREKAAPSFSAMAGLAQAANVRLEWLATGEGPMERPGEERGISSGLRAYAEREMGPDANEEDIQEFARRVAGANLKPSAHAVSEPPALPTPAPIETTQQALEVVEEAMGVVGYDPGSRAMTRLMGMLLDQDIKPEALPRILEILRDHESTRNGNT